MIERPALVATDLDGTLVRSDGTLSERTVAALAAVEDSGTPLVFVTGRPPRWMGAVAEQTGHRGLAICANGALMYDLHTERIVASRPIEAGVIREVIDRLRGAMPELGFAVERESGLAREAAYVPYNPALQLDPVPTAELSSEPAVKLLGRHPSLDPDTLLAKARDLVGDAVELTHASSYGLVEISATGVSKASTLAMLCERHGVPARKVVAFGDMPNDLPLLTWAGLAYAVANAHPEVLAAVERHTASNDDDGVARVLEQWFS